MCETRIVLVTRLRRWMEGVDLITLESFRNRLLVELPAEHDLSARDICYHVAEAIGIQAINPETTLDLTVELLYAHYCLASAHYTRITIEGGLPGLDIGDQTV